MRNHLVVTLSLFLFLHLSGCGFKPTAASQSKVLDVPSLVVRIACKDCDIPSEVVKALEEGYVKAAIKTGKTIDPKREAVITIGTYSARGILRFAGPLSMIRIDEIKAVMRVGPREFVMEESARVPFRGIESVARRIGEIAVERLASAEGITS